MATEITGYDLSRMWFDWCFENPELISPNDTALYFFIIEHSNRMGWKEKFGLPSVMCMNAIGIKNWRTYKKSFDNLVNWGFIKVLESSKNQYSANVIALVKNTKAHTKALSKAIQKHSQKQYKSIVDIDKPRTISSNSAQDEISFDEKSVEEIIDQDPEILDTPTLPIQPEIEHPIDPEPIGSEATQKAAGEAWNDQIWREAICMGNSISMEDLTRWMAKYNASLANDVIKDFSTRTYKKMFGGWLSKQIANGHRLPAKDQSAAFTERTKTYAVR